MRSSAPGILPIAAHEGAHPERHGIDDLRPHSAHEIGKSLRRHQSDHRLEDRPLFPDLRVRVGEVVPEGRTGKPRQINNLKG